MITARLRFCGTQKRFHVPDEARAAALKAMARCLTLGGVDATQADKTLSLAAQCSPETLAALQADIAKRTGVAVPTLPAASGLTFQQLGEKWTSEELLRDFPDYVKKKKSVGHDVGRLELLYKTIGAVPLASFALEDAERAMRALDPKLASASRRQYAQLISKVLKLAVYPLKVLGRSPLPAGFLPEHRSKKAKSYLEPAEDAQLLGCLEIPLARRMLYGFLSREGLRAGEAALLTWRDVVGNRVYLDENKTDDPRDWSLSPGVKEALVSFRPSGSPEAAQIFATPLSRLAEALRDDLHTAKVTRAKLFESTETRQQIRAHDLRATFVTLNLAAGKTEAWITDRTGHKSSQMIYKYKRAVRGAVEEKLGELLPLDEAIPEFKAAALARKAESKGESTGPASAAIAPNGARHRPRNQRSRYMGRNRAALKIPRSRDHVGSSPTGATGFLAPLAQGSVVANVIRYVDWPWL